MAFRIFLIILILGNIFLLAQVIQLAWARAAISDVPQNFSSGPENADVTVVVFFDYSCDPCRAAAPVLVEAMKRDGKIRYIARPLPGDRSDSALQADLVYAAGLQGKFTEMNHALLSDFRAVDEKRKAALAAKLDLDLAKLNADMQSPAVQKEPKENEWLYHRYYGTRLPYYVINGRFSFSPAGTPAVDDFLEVFKNARYKGTD